MSELVEKVQAAIDYQIQNHGYGPQAARAAVAAVLEHYSQWHNISVRMMTEIESSKWETTLESVAAAMAAELAALRAAGDGR